MRVIYGLIGFAVLSISSYSCFLESDLEQGERLARTYCGSCHMFPEPSLLDKKTWEKGIMPQMAFRMGLDNSELYSISDKDFDVVLNTIPPNPMVSEREWSLIKNYYRTNAPDSLEVGKTDANPLKQFEVETWKNPHSNFPMTTLVQADLDNKNIRMGFRSSKLYTLSYQMKILDSIQLTSPPSEIIFKKDEPNLVLTMGIMDPNDQALGSLSRLDKGRLSLIDSLKRPVNVVEADLDQDGLPDYVICSFGNYTGNLSIYKNTGQKKFEKIPLSNLPGARKVIVNDFDGDGLQDIISLMTQGDESIHLYLNSGNFKFRQVTLLRFPPVYGSSYFDLADFNNDGKIDLLIASGDNADYSNILKPYHGLRIFINQGAFEFKESYFFPFPGASQTEVEDFDQDGDPDIAAISFFPDFNNPKSGFVYLENKGHDLSFQPYFTDQAANARWLRMEKADIDDDQDMDLLIGSLNFEDGVPHSLRDQWRAENTWMLVLRNNQK